MVNWANLILLGGIAMTTTAASFLIWWFFDQRRDWVVEVKPGEGVVWIGKRKAGSEKVTGTTDGEEWHAKLEPEKTYYRKGWRSGRLIFIDVGRGVQVDPATEEPKRVGYDRAKTLDADLAKAWREDYVGSNALKQFFTDHGSTLVLATVGLIAVLIYAQSGGVA